jgi:hypothetical protein
MYDAAGEERVNVWCPCGRKMYRAWSAGHDEYRCGCGAGVRAVPTRADPHAVSKRKCAVWIGDARCGRPATGHPPSRLPPNPFSPGGRPDPLKTHLYTGVCDQCAERIVTRMLEVEDYRRSIAEAIGRQEIAKVRSEISWKEFTERQAAQKRAETEREKRDAKLAAQAVHVVYYVRLGLDHIKIGTTGRLMERMAELRVANPANLLAVEPGSYDLEKQRHREFDALRYEKRKEDFAEPAELLALAQRLRDQFGDPYAYVASQLAQRGGGDLLSA